MSFAQLHIYLEKYVKLYQRWQSWNDLLIMQLNFNYVKKYFFFFQRLRLHMKACVFLLCHNKESHGLAAGAKMLYEYLEVI